MRRRRCDPQRVANVGLAEERRRDGVTAATESLISISLRFCRRRVVLLADEMLEHLGRPGDRSLHALKKRGHHGRIGAVRDFERGQLRVLDHRRHEIMDLRPRARVDTARKGSMAAENALLEAPARRFGRLAVSEVGEQQDITQHPVRRGADRVRPHEHGLRFAVYAFEPRLAAPRPSLG